MRKAAPASRQRLARAEREELQSIVNYQNIPLAVCSAFNSDCVSAMARLEQKSVPMSEEDAHRYDTKWAAVEACTGCHDDRHTRAYRRSPHARLWQREITREDRPGSGVSCATCQLPREISRRGGQSLVRIQHNQNQNLRPNEKMARGVCLTCHGLGFTLDALADRTLIDKNFSGQPKHQVRSLEMAEERNIASLKSREKRP